MALLGAILFLFPRAPNTIIITITFMFYCFFRFPYMLHSSSIIIIIIIIIIIQKTFCEFLSSVVTRSFSWSLSDSKSLRVSSSLLSYIDDLNSALVCIVSILPLISDFPDDFSKPLGTISSAKL